MSGPTQLIKLFASFGVSRNLLTNRLTMCQIFVPSVGLKTEMKEKIKSLNIPTPPKRPLTPYFRFLAEHRLEIRKEHPQWKVTDITKKCAENWKQVDDSVKEKYQSEYSKDVIEYEKLNHQFTASLTKEQSEALIAIAKEKRKSKERRIIRKRKRETAKPKRPLVSFLYYINEKRKLPENISKNLGEILQQYKESWSRMSSEEKEKYIKMQDNDKQRYEKEMAEWEAKMIKEGNLDVVRKDSQFVAASKDPPTSGLKKMKTIKDT